MATADTVHRHVAPDLALYAIGAVDSQELEAVGSHVAECPRCQEEVARLRDAASMLAPVTRRDLDACWKCIERRLQPRSVASWPTA
jgi:anti-sigma factor ChrR (cupin superfamily)